MTARQSHDIVSGKMAIVASDKCKYYDASSGAVKDSPVVDDHTLIPLKECGIQADIASFSIMRNGVSDFSDIQSSLDNAERHGLKIFVRIAIPSNCNASYMKTGMPEGFTSLNVWKRWIRDWQEIVRKFRTHPAVAGWMLCDEPSYSVFEFLGACKEEILAIDNTHIVYVNLLPSYGGNEQLRGKTCNADGTVTEHKDLFPDPLKDSKLNAELHRKLYQLYLDKFEEAFHPDVWAYDNYRMTATLENYVNKGDDIDRNSFYNDLESFAAMSRKTGRPFWTYLLVVSHKIWGCHTIEKEGVVVYEKKWSVCTSYSRNSLPALEFQTNLALAYGAQGFVAWTFFQRPDTYKRADCGTGMSSRLDTEFIEAPVNLPAPEYPYGEKTLRYDDVLGINEYIAALEKVFYGCVFVDAQYACNVEDIPPLGKVFEEGFADISKLQYLDDQGVSNGVLVTMIKNNGAGYAIVVNRNYNARIILNIEFGNKAEFLKGSFHIPSIPYAEEIKNKQIPDTGVDAPDRVSTSFKIKLERGEMAIFQLRVE